MIDRLDLLRQYLAKLGIDPVIAQLYYSLHSHGPQTISQLARTSGVERTLIYRLLSVMQSNALVEVDEQYKSKLLRAAPLSNLHILFTNKEQELSQLQQELPKLEELLANAASSSSPTRIQFYHGPDGAKQMLWNETKAKTDVVAILYENIQVRTAEKFFERWVRRCNERGIISRSVVSDEFIQSQTFWYATHQNEMLSNWSGRYIAKAIFPIDHSTIIYDDVTAFYRWKDEEIFGIEIHNHDIANTQRHFFEMLWDKAESLPKLIK